MNKRHILFRFQTGVEYIKMVGIVYISFTTYFKYTQYNKKFLGSVDASTNSKTRFGRCIHLL